MRWILFLSLILATNLAGQSRSGTTTITVVAGTKRINITPSSSELSRICVDAGPLQLRATVRNAQGVIVNRRVQWWSSTATTVVDSTGRVSRNVPENGFGYTAIIVTDGPPLVPLGNIGTPAADLGVAADTAWLMFSGLKWPNEPGTTDAVSC